MTTDIRTDDISPQASLADQLAWLERHGINLSRIPGHMRAGTALYLLFGIPPGSFASAVFANDLLDAYGRADSANTAAMREWANFVYNEMPHESHGSRKAVSAWIERGGLLNYQGPGA